MLWQADFTQMPVGAASVLVGLLRLTRASGATVQTGTSTLVTGVGNDTARIGRALDADPLGLVIEESRTNNDPGLAAWTTSGVGVTYTPAFGPDPSGGGTGSARQQTTGANQYCRDNSISVANRTITLWMRYRALGQALVKVADPNTAASIATDNTTTLWRRYSFFQATSQGIYTPQSGAGSADVELWGPQTEIGTFATEIIATAGASATRAGEHLWHPYGAQLLDAGRFGLWVTLQAKGATTDYAGTSYLWSIDGSNYATINNTTGAVTVVIAGSSYTTSSGFTWSQGDVLDIWIEAGGVALQTVVKMRKNSGAVTVLGTSGSPQGRLTAANPTIDLLCNGTASQLSSRIRQISAWAQGTRPGWAA